MIINEKYELFNNAIIKLKKCFGGIDVVVKNDSIIVITPTLKSSDTIRQFGILILIEGKEILLTEEISRDILLYGDVVSEEFSRPFISEDRMILYDRYMKINKLKNHDNRI